MASKQSYTRELPEDSLYAKGKFLYLGEDKFLIKGVTYGTFRPDKEGHQFPDKKTVSRDFEMMAAHGVNCVRTYTVPPLYVLDQAGAAGLKVMVGLPWEQHLTFWEHRDRIIADLRGLVRGCRAHPAILCYAIGNEIPATIVRWYGKNRIEGFLKRLYRAVKSEDPRRLVTYVNYPTTEYLELPFVDFYCFNVYLESQETLSLYLNRLHTLSSERPLVLAEIGLDSLRNSPERQSEVLKWQIETIYGRGAAGLFLFSWTDEWWRGGFEIEDWDFGLVDRNRQAKPALKTVTEAMFHVPLSRSFDVPFISVIVCSYNGFTTIRETLQALVALDYPQFEVIVVNDGSGTGFDDLVRQYPVTLISTPNRGLSSARNTGLYAAQGEGTSAAFYTAGYH